MRHRWPLLLLLAACSSSESASSPADAALEADAVVDAGDPCVAALARCPATFSAAHAPTAALCPAGGDALVTTTQCHGYQLLKHTEAKDVEWLCFYDKTSGALLGVSDASGTGKFHDECPAPGSLWTTPVGAVGDFDGPCAYASVCPGDAGPDAAAD